MLRPIKFYDTTLRDGEQTPFVVFSVSQKLTIAHALAEMGMDIIEVGFPAASESEQEVVRLAAKVIRGPVIAGLARSRISDVETTAKALEGADKARISIVLPVSDRHLSASLNLTRSEAGATTLVIADTVGCGLPNEIKSLFERLRSVFPEKIKLGIHCHDDFGLATANSLAAIEGGAGQVEGTINGLGERAGNTALEEVAIILKYHQNSLKLNTNIKFERILETSKLVREVSGVVVQPNKALVGQNAFLHAAGMHQQAMLADPLTFEPFGPDWVGENASLEDRIIFGKFLGKNGLKRLLALDGVELSDPELEALVARIRAAIERRETVSRRTMLSWAKGE